MFPFLKHNTLAMLINRITLMTALGAAAFGAGFLPQSARAQLVVDYTFNSTASVPNNGQATDIQTLGGLASFSNVKVNLALTSTSGSTMWLGDLYSTLTFGTASEASRTSVLLNRPGRSNTSIAGSGLSSLNVTLDDTAATNIFGTTSSTGTYQSDGRIGVNPAGPRVAFNPADRTATLAALNGGALASNKFTLLVADYSAPNLASLTGWGMTLTGTAAASGTMAATNGTMTISDGAGTTNTLGAALVTTQNGSGGTLIVNLAGTTTLNGGVSGSGALDKQGVGSLIVNSAGSYTGATTITGGTLQLGTGSTAGTLSTSSAISIAAGANFAIDRSNAVLQGTDFSNAISGSGAFIQAGGGTTTLSAGNTYTGGTFVNAGTLALGASNALADSGAVAVAGGTFAIGGNSDTVGAVTMSSGSITGTGGTLTGTSYGVQAGNISANLAGSGALTKSTAGTVILTGANSYSGGTVINGGTLQLNANNVLPDSGTVTLNGGTVQLNGVSEGTHAAAGAGMLSLTSNSVIDLASTSLIHFLASNTLAGTWAGNALSIWNWNGIPLTGGGLEQILFGSDSTALTVAQLAAITFYSDSGLTSLGTATWATNGGGEIVPLSEVPEPGTWFVAALVAATLLVTQRRRLFVRPVLALAPA